MNDRASALGGYTREGMDMKRPRLPSIYPCPLSAISTSDENRGVVHLPSRISRNPSTLFSGLLSSPHLDVYTHSL